RRPRRRRRPLPPAPSRPPCHPQHRHHRASGRDPAQEEEVMIAVRRRRSPTTNQGGAQIPTGGVAGAVAPGSIEVTPRFLRVGDGVSAPLVVTGYSAE